MPHPDYYKILGVNRTASERDIKIAYRRLARRYHPDLNPNNPRAEEILKAINEAHEVLGDRVQRRQYDAQWADTLYTTSTAPHGHATPATNDAPRPSAHTSAKTASDPDPFFYVRSYPMSRQYDGMSWLWLVMLFAGLVFMYTLFQPAVKPEVTPSVYSLSRRIINESLSGPATQVLLPKKDNAVQIDHLLPGQKVVIHFSGMAEAGQVYVGVKNLPAATDRQAPFIQGRWAVINLNDYYQTQFEVPISQAGDYVVFAEVHDFKGSVWVDANIVQP